jgi:hypothetical protein
MTGPPTSTSNAAAQRTTAEAVKHPQPDTGQPAQSGHATPPLSLGADRLSAFKPRNMLKLWPLSAGETTPKARPAGHEHNPFDDPALALTTQAPSDAAAGGLTTPTAAPSHSFHHHHLLHPSRPLSPSVSGTAHSLAGALNSHDHSSPGPSTPRTTVAPTTHLSIHDPVFNMQQPPPGRNHTTPSSNPKSSNSSSDKSSSPPPVHQPSTTSNSSTRGQLHMKLISARGLNVSSHHSRPYVVVQYDGNEFVSRDPIAETEKEVKGSAIKTSIPSAPGLMSRNPSTNALTTLASLHSNANKKSGGKGASNTNSASSSVGSTDLASAMQATTLSGGSWGLFGGISPYNPVWKHEVSL